MMNTDSSITTNGVKKEERGTMRKDEGGNPNVPGNKKTLESDRSGVKIEESGRMRKEIAKVEEENRNGKKPAESVAEIDGSESEDSAKVEEGNRNDEKTPESVLEIDGSGPGAGADCVKIASVSRSTMRRKRRAAKEKLLKEERKKQEEEHKEEIVERVVATRATANRGRWAGGAMRGNRAGSGNREEERATININFNIIYHRMDPMEMMLMHLMGRGSRGYYSDCDSD